MRIEKTRVRNHGTKVTNTVDFPDPAKAKVDAFRQIVDNWQYAIIDNVTVDAFSASYVVAVYDALNDENKAKYASLPVAMMVDWAFKLTKGR